MNDARLKFTGVRSLVEVRSRCTRRTAHPMNDTSVNLVSLLEALPDTVLVVDEQGRIAHANGAVTALLGYDPAELVGQPIGMLVPQRFRQSHEAKVAHYQRQGQPMQMTNRPLLFAEARDGLQVPVTVSLAPVELAGKRCTVAVVRDGSRIHYRIGEALAQAETDALTGLGNRSYLIRRLEQLVVCGEGFSVLYMDLVGFKPFNDRFGHQVGDEVLRIIARRVNAAVRTADAAARLGGDEFVVLLSGLSDRGLLGERAEAVARHITRPIQLTEIRETIGVSIGAAVFPHHGTTARELLDTADHAMYEAKRERKTFCLAGEAPLALAV